MRAIVPLTVLVVLHGCSTYVDYLPPAPDDAAVDAHAFSPCEPPCGPGARCFNLACVRVDAGTSAGGDAQVADAGPRPDAASRCCPIDTPSCGCVHVGGARAATGVCPVVCDTVGPRGWVRATDFEGCPYWIFPAISCLAQRDGGADAVTPLDAATDGPDGTPAD